MASTKTYISVGFLLLTILIGSYVMVTMGDTLRIKVEATQSTFQSYINGSWQTAGIEKNALFNGSKSIIRNASLGNITYTIDQTNNKTVITRKNYYKAESGPVITDIYVFDGNTKSVELFPISHKVIIENATGLIYQYQVTSLEYAGKTFTNAKSPQSFGKNMKVEWYQNPYYSQVYKYATSNTGKLTLKYKINSSYAEYDVRLFDPVLPNLTIDLLNTTYYMGGNYEFDQVLIQGTLNVNSTIGYLNITANNITITSTGKILGDGLGNNTGGSGGTGGGSPCGSGATGTNALFGGATAGSGGTSPSGACSAASGGSGASTVIGTLTSRYELLPGAPGAGGGGGSGGSACCGYASGGSGSQGGTGGSAIRLNAPSITVAGNITAKGGTGGNGGGGYDGGYSGCGSFSHTCGGGGGGGSAGGQIVLDGSNIIISRLLDVSGGAGGTGGPGGEGSGVTANSGTAGVGGRIKIFYNNTLTTTGMNATLGTSGTYYTEFLNINITQISPAANNYSVSNTNTFNCSFNSSSTGVPIYNIGLNIYNSAGSEINHTYVNTSGFPSKTAFNYNWSNYYVNQSGKFNWTCTAYAKPYDLNSTGGTGGTLTDFNYSADMQKGFELNQRTLFIDNYTLFLNWSNNMVNNTWYNVNTTTTNLNISGVPSYNVSFVLSNSSAIVNSTNLSDIASITYLNLSDEYYNLSANVTTCPLCQYTAQAKNYSSYLTGFLFNIDTVMPSVSWDNSTTALNRTANFSLQNWIYGRTNITELNLKNVTFRLRTSTNSTYNITVYNAT